MHPTDEQLKTSEKILQNNPSMIMIGSFGYYSNGDVTMSIYWKHSIPKEIFHITIDSEGKQK